LNITVEPLTLQIFVRSWRKNGIVCHLFTAIKESHDSGRREVLYCVCASFLSPTLPNCEVGSSWVWYERYQSNRN